MCRSLDDLQEAVVDFARAFDARLFSTGDASKVVAACARIKASISSVEALAAARAGEGDGWKAEGYRSAHERLARQTGMTPSRARRVLETGKRLSSQPAVAQVALAGGLSADQAEAVADGVSANPAKAAELIQAAQESSMGELTERVAAIKAAGRDLEQRRQYIQRNRSLRRWVDTEGGLCARLYGHPEDGVAMWQALDPIRRRLIVLRRRAGTPNEPLEALDYDAFVTIMRVAAGVQGEMGLADLVDLGLFPEAEALGSRAEPPPTEGGRGRDKKLAGSPAEIMIRVDLDTLLRGVALDGELCEIPGYGPVPLSVVEDLAASGNTFVCGMLTKSEQVIGVYRPRRRPNAYQKDALRFIYPTCAAKGCNTKAGLQIDHRIDWSKTHYTAYDLLDRLCRHHHQLKTNQGWALVQGRGKRDFVAPADPRHPDHQQTSGRTECGPDP